MVSGKGDGWAAVFDRFKNLMGGNKSGASEPKNTGHSMDVLLQAQVNGSQKLDQESTKGLAAGIRLRLPAK